MKPILKIDGVTGGYGTTKPTIRDLHFTVHEGEIVALIGLNGAGKSTTIKHILGLMKPIQGRITIYDQSVFEAPDIYRSYYAYIPETPVYYKELTLWEHLELTAMVYGISKEEMVKRVTPLLSRFNMEKKERLFPEHFSKGMRQKMMIMMAFLIQPALYIIDEPLMGLDPLGIRSLLTLLKEERDRGAGILMSTHILSTAERYCDRFIIIHEGEIVAQGSLEELRKAANLSTASLDEIYLNYIEGSVN